MIAIAPTRERRLLQAAVALACVVPVSAGLAGLATGTGLIPGAAGPVDLDSHLRYLSGLLLAIGLAFLGCLPKIEACGGRFRLLAGIVVIGGLGRLLGVAITGWPGSSMVFGLAMELLVTPALALWQARLARRWERHRPA